MLELTGFLGLTRISFFLLTQIPLYCFVGGKSHRCFCVWAGSRGFHFAFGLTRISQIPRYCFVGGKSHRCFCAWVARADSTLLLGSHRSHSIALCVGNLTDDSACGLCSRGFRLVFGLTRISQIPRCCFVGGKSHRWLCGCGLLGAARGSLSRTYLLDPSDKSDLSDKSDGLDIFKNNPLSMLISKFFVEKISP